MAGLRRKVADGADLSEQTVVCIITGSGLKDPDIAMTIPGARHDVAADIEAVESALGWS